MEITRIGMLIYVVRGQRVMMDRDLAALYGVKTGALNRAVSRNMERFPAHFMFQLNAAETRNWISQIVISNSGLKMGQRKLPYAFTERMEKAEKKLGEHEGHIGTLFEEIEALSKPPAGAKRNIGFVGD
jgi:hypothetical protein